MPEPDRTPLPEPTPIETPTDTRTPVGLFGKPLAPSNTSRRDRPSDLSITSQLARISRDNTPAPLPPSPATERDGWFDQVATNPAPEAPRMFAEIGSSPGGGNERAASIPPPTSAELTQPLAKLIQERPRLVPLLIAMTFLVVGMVFGALLAGSGDHAAAGSPGAADCVCPDATR